MLFKNTVVFRTEEGEALDAARTAVMFLKTWCCLLQLVSECRENRGREETYSLFFNTACYHFHALGVERDGT